MRILLCAVLALAASCYGNGGTLAAPECTRTDTLGRAADSTTVTERLCVYRTV